MPTFHIELFEGRTVEQKRQFCPHPVGRLLEGNSVALGLVHLLAVLVAPLSPVAAAVSV